jgi:hypothetical protein
MSSALMSDLEARSTGTGRRRRDLGMQIQLDQLIDELVETAFAARTAHGVVADDHRYSARGQCQAPPGLKRSGAVLGVRAERTKQSSKDSAMCLDSAAPLVAQTSSPGALCLSGTPHLAQYICSWIAGTGSGRSIARRECSGRRVPRELRSTAGQCRGPARAEAQWSGERVPKKTWRL